MDRKVENQRVCWNWLKGKSCNGCQSHNNKEERVNMQAITQRNKPVKRLGLDWGAVAYEVSMNREHGPIIESHNSKLHLEICNRN